MYTGFGKNPFTERLSYHTATICFNFSFLTCSLLHHLCTRFFSFMNDVIESRTSGNILPPISLILLWKSRLASLRALMDLLQISFLNDSIVSQTIRYPLFLTLMWLNDVIKARIESGNMNTWQLVQTSFNVLFTPKGDTWYTSWLGVEQGRLYWTQKPRGNIASIEPKHLDTAYLYVIIIIDVYKSNYQLKSW